jgi:hypothetical protein
VKFRLVFVALVALGCGRSAISNVSARSEPAPAAEPLAPTVRAAPRIGPFAGAGSGVRRVDVAQR